MILNGWNDWAKGSWQIRNGVPPFGLRLLSKKSDRKPKGGQLLNVFNRSRLPNLNRICFRSDSGLCVI